MMYNVHRHKYKIKLYIQDAIFIKISIKANMRKFIYPMPLLASFLFRMHCCDVILNDRSCSQNLLFIVLPQLSFLSVSVLLRSVFVRYSWRVVRLRFASRFFQNADSKILKNL